MTIGLTYKELKDLFPCQSHMKRVVKLLGGARKWGTRSIPAAEAREAGCTFHDLIWAAAAVAEGNPDVARRLRLTAADFAAHVLQHYDAEYRSDAPRKTIVTARHLARGEPHVRDPDAERAAHTAFSRVIDNDAATHAAYAAYTALAYASLPFIAALSAAQYAQYAAYAYAVDAKEAERKWQFDRLIARLSDPEPEDWPLPEVPTYYERESTSR